MKRRFGQRNIVTDIYDAVEDWILANDMEMNRDSTRILMTMEKSPSDTGAPRDPGA